MIEHKSTPYPHKPRPEIEKYANEEEWTKNTLHEANEHLVSQTSLQTPIPKDKDTKRIRENMSLTDSESQDFRVFKRRMNINLED